MTDRTKATLIKHLERHDPRDVPGAKAGKKGRNPAIELARALEARARLRGRLTPGG
jgi:hypothetical protein